MIRFLIGFATGAATMIGLLIIEDYLEQASLRDEGRLPNVEPAEWAEVVPLTWTAA
jgi:hypothetical protein